MKRLGWLTGLWMVLSLLRVGEAGDRLDEVVRPILEDHCYACHGLGGKKGGVAFDGYESDEALRGDRRLWLAVLKNVRAGVMPPPGEPRLEADEIRQLEDWIKSEAFGLNPAEPDPGRVVVRRLNRVEYRNTIRDLMGVDYDTQAEFPADDTGHGFDTVGEVLTVSPLLLEKYLDAARAIVRQAVPRDSGVPATARVPGYRFKPEGLEESGRDRPAVLTYREGGRVSAWFEAPHEGRYRIRFELTATERYVDGVNDYSRCRLVVGVDDQEVERRELGRQENRRFEVVTERDWEAGRHRLTVEVESLTPELESPRWLAVRVDGVDVVGPLAREYWVKPPGYERFFPESIPNDAAGRRDLAAQLLGRFATRAYRRPVDEATVGRLVDLAERIWSQEGGTFEAGVAEAMTAVLASPRFLFREEGIVEDDQARHPLIDEYALASRLSYFLWSTMPDEELFRLAGEGRLRAELDAQIDRMLADRRSEQLVRQFVGQWLQTRDLDGVTINAFAVALRDQKPDPEADRRRERFRALRRKEPEQLTEEEKAELQAIQKAFAESRRRFEATELTGELRRAMRRETELLVERIFREGRPLHELIDADYTYLNERLARHYEIEGVEGDQMRLVKLPPENPRGGLLTQGTFLVVTSNPDRTSPVKRGLYILENLLGTPPPPPPPDIPALEDSARGRPGPPPTLREALAVHRAKPACASCHDRMDPLGLAFENFNAVGRWREAERGQPIDPSGSLITGESFASFRELKRVLANDRRRDFYRCVVEKLLTYALGRGLDENDVGTVDDLVARLESEGGRADLLIRGVIHSAPFQRRRREEPAGPALTQRVTPIQPGEEHR
ncbi:MAG: filamin [Isosphaeraceae bacterium]|jgi:hypothetical protein|nr:MAG: filamin [Isosphaeraceae bacterium]